MNTIDRNVTGTKNRIFLYLPAKDQNQTKSRADVGDAVENDKDAEIKKSRPDINRNIKMFLCESSHS